MTPSEVSAKGRRIYDERLRAVLEPSCVGRYVALDVDSGDYVVAEDAGRAAVELKARRRSATIFAIRIGYPSTYRVGARWTRSS